MRFDASMESLINIGRSESFADLNNTEFGLSRQFLNQPSGHRDLYISSQSKCDVCRTPYPRTCCVYSLTLNFIIKKNFL